MLNCLQDLHHVKGLASHHSATKNSVRLKIGSRLTFRAWKIHVSCQFTLILIILTFQYHCIPLITHIRYLHVFFVIGNLLHVVIVGRFLVVENWSWLPTCYIFCVMIIVVTFAGGRATLESWPRQAKTGNFPWYDYDFFSISKMKYKL